MRRAGGLNPGPSLDGGFEELRELRPIRSRRRASSVAKAASWLRSCSISCCWARMNALASGGHNSQSASGIPAGGELITGGLCLRCKPESSSRQGFSRAQVRRELSRPLNGYRMGYRHPQLRSTPRRRPQSRAVLMPTPAPGDLIQLQRLFHAAISGGGRIRPAWRRWRRGCSSPAASACRRESSRIKAA